MSQEVNHLGQPIGCLVPNWQPPSLPARESIQGRFCRIEPLNVERHAHELFQANSLDTEGRNWTYLHYGPFNTFEDYEAWLTECQPSHDPLYFVFIDQATNHAIGLGSWPRIDQRQGTIEIGHLNFSPLMQGKSAATEAMYLLMQRAFELGYRRYEWKCHWLNAPSRKAAQRLGFSYEGIFRQALVVKGRNRDTAWYAIIDEEWPELKRAFQQWLDPANFVATGKQNTSLSSLTARIVKQRG